MSSWLPRPPLWVSQHVAVHGGSAAITSTGGILTLNLSSLCPGQESKAASSGIRLHLLPSSDQPAAPLWTGHTGLLIGLCNYGNEEHRMAYSVCSLGSK